MPFARAAFAVISLATVIFFSMGVPVYFRGYIESIDADTLSALQGLGLSTTFYATYQTVLVVLLAIAFSIAGLIIAWNKSDDWLALLVAFTLVGQGATAFGPLQHVPMPEAAAEAIRKALAKKPEDGFASVGEFVTEIGKA